MLITYSVLVIYIHNYLVYWYIYIHKYCVQEHKGHHAIISIMYA